MQEGQTVTHALLQERVDSVRTSCWLVRASQKDAYVMVREAHGLAMAVLVRVDYTNKYATYVGRLKSSRENSSSKCAAWRAKGDSQTCGIEKQACIIYIGLPLPARLSFLVILFPSSHRKTYRAAFSVRPSLGSAADWDPMPINVRAEFSTDPVAAQIDSSHNGARHGVFGCCTSCAVRES